MPLSPREDNIRLRSRSHALPYDYNVQLTPMGSAPSTSTQANPHKLAATPTRINTTHGSSYIVPRALWVTEGSTLAPPLKTEVSPLLEPPQPPALPPQRPEAAAKAHTLPAGGGLFTKLPTNPADGKGQGTVAQ